MNNETNFRITVCGLLTLAACATVFAGPARAASQDPRLVQDTFDSASDEFAFQRAIAKAVGREVRLGGARSDRFGISVALSGDTALVGATFRDTPGGAKAGAAYIFTRSGGTWTQQAELTAADGAADDEFGNSVALSGDTALVGASFDATLAGIDVGSAYVFTRSGGTWTQQAKLTAGDGATGDQFGVSVALVGDTALVGAWLDSTPAGGAAGSAYVFTRTGATWTQQAKLAPDDAAPGEWFGASVAISGDTALVGAWLGDTPAGVNAGAAYVFTRSGTAWTQQAKLTAGDGAARDFFGYSAALSGDTALVGANGDDTPAGTDAGSAYVFTRSDTTWTQQTMLTAGDGAASDKFGWSVALSGDTALVGAHLDDTPGGGNAGSAHVFTRSGTTWTQQAKLTAGDGLSSDEFGESVALSGDSALVGTTFAGAAYIYLIGIFEDGFEDPIVP